LDPAESAETRSDFLIEASRRAADPDVPPKVVGSMFDSIVIATDGSAHGDCGPICDEMLGQ